MRRLFLIVLALTVSACGGGNGSTSPTPSVAQIGGSWGGQVTHSSVGQGTLQLTLAQNGSAVNGTFSTAYAVAQGSGSFTGTVTASSLTAVLTPSVPTLCPANVTATVSSTSISGTWAAFNCSGPESGTFSVTRR